MTPNDHDATQFLNAVGIWIAKNQVPPRDPYPRELLDLVVAHLTLAYTAGEIVGMHKSTESALKVINEMFGPATKQGS